MNHILVHHVYTDDLAIPTSIGKILINVDNIDEVCECTKDTRLNGRLLGEGHPIKSFITIRQFDEPMSMGITETIEEIYEKLKKLQY